MFSNSTLTLSICFILFCLSPVVGQKSYGGQPLGLTLDWKKEKKSLSIGDISKEVLQAYESKNSVPLYALPIDLNQDYQGDIFWTSTEDELIGLLSIQLDNASGVAILLNDFKLPQDGRLFIYDDEGKDILGAYTSRNNNVERQFLSEVISGAEIIVEVALPISSKKKFPFKIEKFYKVLNHITSSSAVIDTGFNASYECHQNINCTIGENVRKEQRGVMRIMMVLEEGLGWCSGSLMNNTRQDRSPLVLSAYHCQDTYTPLYNLWRFDFNFEASACNNPSDAPGRQSMIGCEQLAGKADSDFILYRLKESIPANYNVYFNGWDRSEGYEPIPTTFIHHPAGDIKKVCLDNDDLRIWASSTNWDNGTRTPASSHYRLDLEQGSHQPGSSGGPLFDNEGRVVAQLHGGNTDTSQCNLTVAYFGRLSQSWDGDSDSISLASWLDPLGLDTVQWDGVENQVIVENVVNLQGQILTPDSKPLGNVSLSLSGPGSFNDEILTDELGNYNFTNVPAGGNYVITPSKNSNHGNGLSASDLVIITNHIIGTNTLADIFKIMAADVNENGSISGTDIVQIQNVILGLRDEFVSAPAWGFLPKTLEIDTDNFNPDNLKITGFKFGDVNNSASNQ